MFPPLAMYHHEEKKSSSSNNKIFRPWDMKKEAIIVQQDSTISTTSEPTPSDCEDITKSPRNIEPLDIFQSLQSSTSSNGLTNLEAYYSSGAGSSLNYLPLHPQEYLPGLSTDLLLSQNYALEEYARILSQDHQAKLLNARKQRPKKYKCPHCDVGFSNNGQLKGHIRIHTGERPFKCDDANCGKTFTRNEELTRHKRIHSGLRPFSCGQCGKRFGRKDHLKKHSRTHMQPRNGMYAVPVMLPLDTWAQASYPYMTSVPILY